MSFNQIEEGEIPDEALEAAAMKEVMGAWTFICTSGIQCHDVFE